MHIIGTTSLFTSGTRKVESVTILNRTRLEVVYRTLSNTVFTSNPPVQAPDYIEKEIYEVKDNKLVWVKTVSGVHTPAHSVPESIAFPE
jgi:hypothetical protein